MLTLDIIEKEIANIILHGDNYTDCEHLAYLYICKAGLTEKAQIPVPSGGDSEFLKAAGQSANCWEVLDELMEVLKVLNPNLYAGVMSKLNG